MDWYIFWGKMINSGEVIIYLGRREGRYYEGVVFVLRKVVVRFLIEYYFVSERMIRVRFNIKFIKIFVI